ncbi:MAG: segregation/condensation protein A [Planctomycetaceae bacterium]
MILAEYQVNLGIFGGPMDLLLYLVRRHELDIRRISLAQVTRDFQQFLEVLEFLDLDLMGEFVVVASTLLEIKSREVLPQQETQAADTDEVDDSPSDIIGQLLQYKKFKDAASRLSERASAWLERYPRLSDDRPDQKHNHALDRIREVELWDLVSALGRIVKLPEVEASSSIRMDETPLSVHQDRIRQRLLTEEQVAFSSFFDGEHLQSRIVGIFQAILELIRHESYRAIQPEMYGEIWVMAPLEGYSNRG